MVAVIRWVCASLCWVLLVLSACSSGSESVAIADAQVTTAVPQPTETAVPEPTATAAPEPTATATPVPEPTPTPSPSPVPEPRTFQERLELIRAMADLPAKGLDYDDYVDIADDSGLVTMTVPASWTDIRRDGFDVDGVIVGPALTASPDIDSFLTVWGTPGAFLAASDELAYATPREWMQEFWYGESCTFIDTYDYDDGFYFGLADLYLDCGPEKSSFIQVVAAPADNSYLIEGQFLLVVDRDFDAILTIVDSFIISVDAG